MRKVFFVSAFIIAVIAGIIACNNNSKEPAAGTTKEDSLKKIIDRGAYLANYVSMCMDCHTRRDFSKYAGPVIADSLGGGGDMFNQGVGIPGEVTPPNITPFALKDWSDEEIERAMIKGINKKGDTLFPIMPYHSFSRLDRADLHAIIAYVRSLKEVNNTVAPRKLMIPPSMFGPLPENSVADNKRPDASDKIKYGEYMVTAALCSDCHTPMTEKGPDFSKFLSGGFTFDIGLFKVTAGNITPDSATGIGTWTEDAFIAKFKANAAQSQDGKNPGRFNTIMPWAMYAKMKEEDLRAIYTYLRTVPPVTNKVEKWPK